MNHSRRNFLRQTALAGAAISLPFQNQLMAMYGRKNPFAIQLWTVKEALYKDTIGVLTHLSKSGYKQIEGFEGTKGIFWGMKNTELKKVMDDLGMSLVSSHCEINIDFERKAAEAAEIGMKYLICPHKGAQTSIDFFKRFSDEFNACGEITKKNGLRFAYHNHDYSFKAMNGIVPQDVMMQSTNPATVDFEMDMYWTVVAGVDPIAYMKKFPNRFKLVHVKDLAKTATGEESCIIGKGAIDYMTLLPEANEQGVQYYIVEQEAYTGTNELDCAKQDAAYLKTLKW
ncbi:MAG: sugar phosphate isomerase/epimerase [Chitinophagia bacterium]|jgi:sugar phosphate isomerase/epimerase